MITAELWDAIIAGIKDVLTIVTLLGVLWSVVEFIRKQRSDREELRQAKVAAWRKARIQHIQHESPDFLTAAQMTDRLRSSSFDQDFDIRKSELTEQAVRLILLEMIRDGILVQAWGDSYGLKQKRFDPSVQVADQQARNFQISRDALDLIVKYPGHYDDARLFKDVVGDREYSQSDFFIVMTELSMRGLVRRDAAGHWCPAIPSAVGSAPAQGS